MWAISRFKAGLLTHNLKALKIGSLIIELSLGAHPPSHCEDAAHAMDEDASRAVSPDAPPRIASDEEEVVDKHGIPVSVKLKTCSRSCGASFTSCHCQPRIRYEVRAAHDDLILMARNTWNQWKNLFVKWPCSTRDCKYNALQLYREVDILAWSRDNGEDEFPSVAILARIYLGKPLSTATQERFFLVKVGTW
ncbi:unnamed protein product [Phytophthora fragariaefolia]|uniref:Unnamed protein product n=1 Tax=Phytophthora fragariaefolia TaxID=1490495 RepID=A0A9W7DB61_9STRA|nr:unnamed protein product [Phytophthora fragariaefolia]